MDTASDSDASPKMGAELPPIVNTSALKQRLDHYNRRLSETTMTDVWNRSKQVAQASWARSTRRMRIACTVILTLNLLALALQTSSPPPLPSVTLEYHYRQQASKFNESKLALLIENRPNPILAPLLLHFISVVPPDWRFRFMGSVESVESVGRSVAIREQVRRGKLDLTYIPANMSTGSQEEISRFLTDLWLYETLLRPAEWLLVFQTDSILCANSRRTLNDYLAYDWVGAPWRLDGRFGGNGGLSLRRVGAIVDVLRNQRRVDGTEPEDVWLTDRLGHRPGSRLANGTVSAEFSGEMYPGEETRLDTAGEAGRQEQQEQHPRQGAGASSPAQEKMEARNRTLEAARQGALVPGIDDWREGFYEPMGYHTGGSGQWLHSGIWGTPELRKHIWDYCPEVKMTLAMDVARFVPGECGAVWKKTKRDSGEGVGSGEEESAGDAEFELGNDLGYGTEMIDGVEYPLLPEGLVPW